MLSSRKGHTDGSGRLLRPMWGAVSWHQQAVAGQPNGVARSDSRHWHRVGELYVHVAVGLRNTHLYSDWDANRALGCGFVVQAPFTDQRSSVAQSSHRHEHRVGELHAHVVIGSRNRHQYSAQAKKRPLGRFLGTLPVGRNREKCSLLSLGWLGQRIGHTGVQRNDSDGATA